MIGEECLDVRVWSGILAKLMLPVKTLIDQCAQSRGFKWREIKLVPEERVSLDKLLKLHEHDVAGRLCVSVLGQLLILPEII